MAYVNESNTSKRSMLQQIMKPFQMQINRTNTHFEENTTIRPPPRDLQIAFNTLFTSEALRFLAELITEFDKQVDQLQWTRKLRKYRLKSKFQLPELQKSEIRDDKAWRVLPVPKRLENRKLDLGDVSPANTEHFLNALQANVQGIQVDFDDGHCPNWRNQILGLYNVYQAVHGNFPNVKDIKDHPILMLRPRAWNMIEHNIMINGKKIAGPLVDFGILMFHNAKILASTGSGPFFYLSKVEGANEAKLWNEIFTWTQRKLGIPYATIKACVLIENILSSFEMEEILYELQDHSLGLNCGIWDYAASIICKFGHHPDFILPDRNKYVNMQRHFLKKYMQLVIQTCHSRGAHATGGMAALLVQSAENEKVIEKVVEGKKLEIAAGVDGFMIYDIKLVPHINKLWQLEHGNALNQLHKQIEGTILSEDLLKMPTGGVTIGGLKHNIEVAILFIYHWLKGVGHFPYKGAVEDSATAEISRSQIWQWILHKAKIEDNGEYVTKDLVDNFAKDFVSSKNASSDKTLMVAMEIFMEVVTAKYFPDFITTYLNDNYIFRIQEFQVNKL